MKTLIIGFGSIGQRHARFLKEIGCEVGVVSRRQIEYSPSYRSVREAITAWKPEYAVIANETSLHQHTFEELADYGFTGRVLVEKPSGFLPEQHPFEYVAVAFNMRFHPLLIALRHALQGERVLTLQVYCGRYLPDWRPQRDYSTIYSAHAELGGGVLRDLSHELDYLLWLAGNWREVCAAGGKLSSLNITSDDAWAILLKMKSGAIGSLQVNYLDHPGRREIVINTDESTYVADLIKGTLSKNGTAESFNVPMDQTYVSQHRAMLSEHREQLCSLAEGIEGMRLIDAVERSARESRWVGA
jgi:predicted dehydrogenase